MSAHLQIGLNALFLAHPTTGSGRYLIQLAHWLPRVAPELGYTVLAPVGPEGKLGVEAPPLHEERGASQRHVTVASPFDRRSENLAKLYLEQVGLPRAAQRAGVDLLHYPYFAAPLRSPVPTIVTVHDLIPVLLPEYRQSWAVRTYMSLVSLASRRAAMLITDSEASRSDLLQVLGVAPDRVVVIPLAPSAVYRPVDNPERIATVRQRYSLRGDYVIYLGSFERRKNVPTLLRAFARARQEPGFTARLALAGRVAPPGPLFPDVRQLARELGLEDAISWLGPIPDEDANALYNGALAFVFPSRYEGFGLPPLEAMAAGAPVICAHASSLPEVVGDAALTFDPDDVAGLATLLVRIAADSTLRQKLRADGRARAASFTWERTARETAQVYREVAARVATAK